MKSLFLILLVIFIIIIARIIKPTNNPKDNINFGEFQISDLKFFLSPNIYGSHRFLFPFYNSKKFKLKEDFKVFIDKLNSSSSTEIIDSLSLELFKASFIRNIKNDRFNILLWLVLGLTVIFFIYYFFYITETNKFLELIKEAIHHCGRI